MTVDIEVQRGGFRAAWKATSIRGKQWAVAHRPLTTITAEFVEQLSEPVDELIDHALNDGLTVDPGDGVAITGESDGACMRWPAERTVA